VLCTAAWLLNPSTGAGSCTSGANVSGEVLAVTERAACLRAIQRFKIQEEDRREMEVRRTKEVLS
jgi:hypothetical protein